MEESVLQASVIICAYTQERWTDLIAAIDSIQKQATQAAEIILVIDHNPELYVMARDQFPEARVIENQMSRGLSGARNIGAAAARYPIMAFMDEDAVAEVDWLSRLLAVYTDNQVIGVGGTVEPMWLDHRPDWFPDEFKWVVGCTYKGSPETRQPIRNMLGCNMSFRREVFSQTGGFRDNLGRLGSKHLLSCEETEFCIRANRQYPGKYIYHEPLARVNHRVPAKRATWYYYRMRCYAEGQSKALVASFVGADDGLVSERKYTLNVLPKGIINGLKESFQHHNMVGISRTIAIIAGLVITSFGYLIGKITIHPEKPVPSTLKL